MSVMWKTKRIETKLNEKQFFDRLKTFCRDKTRFDKGYNDKDVFVVKRNRSKLSRQIKRANGWLQVPPIQFRLWNFALYAKSRLFLPFYRLFGRF